MNQALVRPSIAFHGHRRVAAGPLHAVARAVKYAVESGQSPIFIFDATGRVIDLDPRGSL